MEQGYYIKFKNEFERNRALWALDKDFKDLEGLDVHSNKVIEGDIK